MVFVVAGSLYDVHSYSHGARAVCYYAIKSYSRIVEFDQAIQTDVGTLSVIAELAKRGFG